MPFPEAVENVGRVKPGIVAERARNDLQGLSNSGDDQLFFPGNCAGVVPQILAQFHLNSSTTWGGGGGGGITMYTLQYPTR